MLLSCSSTFPGSIIIFIIKTRVSLFSISPSFLQPLKLFAFIHGFTRNGNIIVQQKFIVIFIKYKGLPLLFLFLFMSLLLIVPIFLFRFFFISVLHNKAIVLKLILSFFIIFIFIVVATADISFFEVLTFFLLLSLIILRLQLLFVI
uniref:Uncharacterized protein n=1 Tax=Opuntia streptacantha TaxID=393608 RepID=A0A7C9EFL9_OPUST